MIWKKDLFKNKKALILTAIGSVGVAGALALTLALTKDEGNYAGSGSAQVSKVPLSSYKGRSAGRDYKESLNFIPRESMGDSSAQEDFAEDGEVLPQNIQPQRDAATSIGQLKSLFGKPNLDQQDAAGTGPGSQDQGLYGTQGLKGQAVDSASAGLSSRSLSKSAKGKSALSSSQRRMAQKSSSAKGASKTSSQGGFGTEALGGSASGGSAGSAGMTPQQWPNQGMIDLASGDGSYGIPDPSNPSSSVPEDEGGGCNPGDRMCWQLRNPDDNGKRHIKVFDNCAVDGDVVDIDIGCAGSWQRVNLKAYDQAETLVIPLPRRNNKCEFRVRLIVDGSGKDGMATAAINFNLDTPGNTCFKWGPDKNERLTPENFSTFFWRGTSKLGGATYPAFEQMLFPRLAPSDDNCDAPSGRCDCNSYQTHCKGCGTAPNIEAPVPFASLNATMGANTLCPAGERCGNGTCDIEENAAGSDGRIACPADCPSAEDTCGNGTCDTDQGETRSNCPQDCGPVGGGGGGGCFIAGTKVMTPEGARSIESVKIGDKVFSFDETAFEKVVSVVVKLEKETVSRLFKGVFSNGAVLRVTPAHRFFDPAAKTYRAMGTMEIGDKALVITAKGAEEVVLVSKEELPETGTRVYNFEVDNPLHNYLVEGILVHNRKCAEPECPPYAR